MSFNYDPRLGPYRIPYPAPYPPPMLSPYQLPTPVPHCAGNGFALLQASIARNNLAAVLLASAASASAGSIARPMLVPPRIPSPAYGLSHAYPLHHEDKSGATVERFSCNSNINNGRVKNPDSEIIRSGVRIESRHSATQMILNWRRRPQHGNADAIKSNIDQDIEKQYKYIKTGKKYIIANDSFGCHLAEQTRNLKPGREKYCLLESCNHSLAYKLQCKSKSSEDGSVSNYYVVQLFMPDQPENLTCVEVNEVNAFARSSLLGLLGDKQYKALFNPDPLNPEEHECIVYDCSGQIKCRPKFIKIESAIKGGISGTVMHHLLSDGGDPDAIRASAPQIKSIGGLTRQKTLQAKSSNGEWGVLKAIRNGNSEAIVAFGDLLSKKIERIPDIRRSRWLLNVLNANEHNKPRILEALKNGNADSVLAFNQLLEKMLPKIKREEETIWINEYIIWTNKIWKDITQAENIGTPRPLKTSQEDRDYADILIYDTKHAPAVMLTPHESISSSRSSSLLSDAETADILVQFSQAHSSPSSSSRITPRPSQYAEAEEAIATERQPKRKLSDQQDSASGAKKAKVSKEDSGLRVGDGIKEMDDLQEVGDFLIFE